MAPVVSKAAKSELARLKLRLSPLNSAEGGLADQLSGGVQVGAGAMKRGAGVYVRSGWQKQVHIGRKRKAGSVDLTRDRDGLGLGPGDGEKDDDLTKIARILWNCKEDIKELWKHPLVRTMLETRQLKLEESAEL